MKRLTRGWDVGHRAHRKLSEEVVRIGQQIYMSSRQLCDSGVVSAVCQLILISDKLGFLLSS